MIDIYKRGGYYEKFKESKDIGELAGHVEALFIEIIKDSEKYKASGKPLEKHQGLIAQVLIDSIRTCTFSAFISNVYKKLSEKEKIIYDVPPSSILIDRGFKTNSYNNIYNKAISFKPEVDVAPNTLRVQKTTETPKEVKIPEAPPSNIAVLVGEAGKLQSPNGEDVKRSWRHIASEKRIKNVEEFLCNYSALVF